MLGVLGFILVSQCMSLLNPYLSGKIVDGLARKKADEVYFFVALSFALWSVRVILGYARDRYELAFIDYRIPERMHSFTLTKLLGFSIGQHTSEHSGIKQNVIGRGKNALISLGDMVMYQFIPLISEVIIMTVTLLYWSVPLGLIVLGGLGAYIIFAIKLNNSFRRDFRKNETNYIRDGKFQKETLDNIALTMAQAQENKMYKECTQSFSGANKFACHVWTRFSKWAMVRNFIPAFTRLAFFLVAVHYVLVGQYSVGQFTMLLMWGASTLANLGEISVMHRRLIQAYISVKKYFEMLEIEPDVKVIPNPVRPDKFSGQIEFRGVTFNYKRRQTSGDPEDDGDEILAPTENNMLKFPALDNVSFTIRAGQTIAIVGESGAGKSTLVKAILRSQDPDTGQIIVDGNDLRVLDLKHFRQSIGLVDQDVSLFDQTLRYNLTYGLNGRGVEVTDQELHHVAEISCIDRFYHRLEKGFDTLIGERGVKLSGGERQRVGIGRALIKEPDILIFDEATSSLDSENEALIRGSINKAAQGRTTIIIAHRFSTIREVDRVLVFEKGQLVGDGTHEELAQSCPEYQRLVRNQTF